MKITLTKNSKLILKILLILVVVIGIIAAVLAVPSPKTDKKIFGDNFEEHIQDKYGTYLADCIFEADTYFDRDERCSRNYYNEEGKGKGFVTSEYIKFTKYDGRNIYCESTMTFDYLKDEEEQTVVYIPFKGRKIIGDVYEWEMLPNDYFPIPIKDDENVDYYFGEGREKFREWFEEAE